MNKLASFSRQGLSLKQPGKQQKLLRKMEFYRQLTLLVLDELRDVDLDIVEMFSDTMAEASDLLYGQHGYITLEMQNDFDELTREYSQEMLDILRSHKSRVLYELEKQGRLLERIDPEWRLLLPSSFD